MHLPLHIELLYVNLCFRMPKKKTYLALGKGNDAPNSEVAKKKRLQSAIRSKRYREKIKNNPEKRTKVLGDGQRRASARRLHERNLRNACPQYEEVCRFEWRTTKQRQRNLKRKSEEPLLQVVEYEDFVVESNNRSHSLRSESQVKRRKFEKKKELETKSSLLKVRS